MLEELKARQAALAKRTNEMAGYLGLADKRLRIAELTAQTEQPGFWDDQQKAQEALRALAREKAGVEPWDQLLSRLDDNAVLIELAEEAEDEETGAEAEAEVVSCEADLTKLEIAAMLGGQYDDGDAILQLAACVPNFLIHEIMITDGSFRFDITDEEVVFDQGDILIPEKPGLGIEVNEEAVNSRPYVPRNLRHYTGTLTDIRPKDDTIYYFKGLSMP